MIDIGINQNHTGRLEIMNDDFFQKEWNVIVTIGTNCTNASIVKKNGMRYFSSPFDNIETSPALVECSALIAREFKGYMDSAEDWPLNTRNSLINRKTACQIKTDKLDFSKITFPHIYREWFPGFKRNDWRNFNKWRSSEDAWDHNQAWERFKTTMHHRQQRLVSLLKSENKILFLRIDASQCKQIFPNNQLNHCNKFVSDIETAYPNADFGFYYLYKDTYYGKPRQPEPFVSASEKMYLEDHGGSTSDTKLEFKDKISKKIEKIKLLPREEMLEFSTEYEKDIFYK